MTERAGHIQSLLDELFLGLREGFGALELDSTVQGLAEIVAGLDVVSGDTANASRDNGSSSEEHPLQEVAQTCDAFFNAKSADDGKPIDLLTWLDGSRPDARGDRDSKAREVGKAREGVLHLLSNLVLIAGPTVLPYVSRIRRTCLLLMDVETSAPAAKALLSPLRRLLEARLLSADAFKPQEVYTKVTEAYRATGSQYHKQPSPKGEALSMMGLVFEVYPTAFGDKEVDTLFSRLMYELDKEWRDAAELGGSKGSEHLPVIAGALEGLHALLKSHSDVIARSAIAAAKLARYIIKGIDMTHSSTGRRVAMEVPDM